MRPNSRTQVYASPHRRLQPGKASTLIKPFCVTGGDLIVLALRKSGRERGTNLSDAETSLRQLVASQGGTVVGVVRHVGSGFYPFWVGRAATIAKPLGAKILAESTDRLIRHPGYHSNNYPDAQAREGELQELQRDADGVPLMTHLHPDATPEEVRSYQRKRGQREKKRHGGRPKLKRTGQKKRSREIWIGRVRQLRIRYGKSLREIATQTGKPLTTIKRWLDAET